MSAGRYDVAIVGARVAGSTLAALLGRAGLRVLLVDRTAFPSDTLSTHVVYGDSFGVWERAGAWPAIEAIGATRLMGIAWDRVGANTSLSAPLMPVNGHDYALCLRRLALDDVLFRSAAETPGVEAVERARVTELLWDGDRVDGISFESRGHAAVHVRARLVVGADGRHSLVARTAGSVEHTVVPPLFFPLYSYLRGVTPVDPPALEIFDTATPAGTIMLCPMDDVLWLGVTYTEQGRWEADRLDHRRSFEDRLRGDPRITHRVADATLETAVKGRGDMRNFMRTAAGPGWALVGDAGQFKDPIYGQGIGDAARSAALLARCVVPSLRDGSDTAPALARYQAHRDRDLVPNFEWMISGAPRGLAPEEFGELRAGAGRSPETARRFINVFSHAVSADEFFNRTELARLRDASETAAHARARAT